MKKHYVKKMMVMFFLLVACISIKESTKIVKAAPAVTVPETADDPQYGKVMGEMPKEEGKNGVESFVLKSSSTTSGYTGKTYTHNEVFSEAQVINGIDVSVYQGDIDWNKVKAAGVDFAFIRVGKRGSTQGSVSEDTNYKKNIENANKAGVKVGVYFYSQAITEAEAVEEANFVLNRIAGYDISMPVVIDYEYAYSGGNYAGRLWEANLSKEAATAICTRFCQTVKSAGYPAAVYANKYMLTERLNAGVLSQNAYIWLAHYTTQTTYTGSYQYWQYSDKGVVNGITGNVDCDFYYDNGYTYKGVNYENVFDASYYLAKYTDIKAAYGNDTNAAFQHFVNYGMNEGRQGNAEFSVQSYRNQYADLRQVYGNDLKSYYLHYINYGKKEGRQGIGCTALQGAVTSYKGIDYSAVYDYYYYIELYTDINSIYGGDDVSALAHFVNYGMSEGRRGKEVFDVYSYKNQYADLRQAYGNNLKSYYLHYISYGKAEGRQGTGCKALQGTTIYNGVDYSAVYNYTEYINTYADIRNLYAGNDVAVLSHFLNYGMNEGRQGNSKFNPYSYQNQYVDLRRAYGSNLKSYYLHYINYGRKEGRQGIGCNILQGAETVYQGVDYADVYNYNEYINTYSDIRGLYAGNDLAVLEHFVKYGMNEGRQGNSRFNAYVYRARYNDLQNAYGNDLKSYYLHYINYGKAEGREAI